MWYYCLDHYGNNQMIYLPGKDIILITGQNYILFKKDGEKNEYASFSNQKEAKTEFDKLMLRLSQDNKVLFATQSPPDL